MLPSNMRELRNIRCLLGHAALGVPFGVGITNLLQRDYVLRCLLFHDISDRPSPFAAGLGISLNSVAFEARVKFAVEHYTPVSLEDVLSNSPRTRFKKPPVLFTFDDAYESVAQVAAPILSRYRVPALMCVTGSLIGNQDLALDNFVCYVIHESGFEIVRSVACEIAGKQLNLTSRKEFMSEFLPNLSQEKVAEFRAALAAATRIRTQDIARGAHLYMDVAQLRFLMASGFEIGSHTFSHVFCRSLRNGDFEREIHGNKRHLEQLTENRVRAFSIPYGSREDLTDDLASHLRRSGHAATFLVESRANPRAANLQSLNRVSVQSESDAEFFSEIEILPRLRSLRDRFKGARRPSMVEEPRCSVQVE